MSRSTIFKNNDEKEVEKHVGIEDYCISHIRGIGGEYKASHKDFIVKEITKDGKTLEMREDSESHPFLEEFKDKYTTFNLIKINKDTFEAINEINKKLKVSSNSIQYSGLKDKCSISVQRVSIKGNYIQKLKNLKLNDIYLRNIIPSNKPIKLGSHFGNNFTIIIRNINPENDVEERISQIVNYLNSMGFPNYYGLQRFGSLRPNSHKIGKSILQQEYEEAYHEFITAIYSTESTKAQQVRINLAKTGDLEKALEEFPQTLRYERKIIKSLIDKPGNYKAAFDTISPGLKTLLISSFQSWIFNKMVSKRREKGFSLFKPYDGDRIVILDDELGNLTQISYIYGGLYDKSLDEAFKMNRAVIVAPLIGYNTKLEDFPLMKDIFQEVASQEKIDINFLDNDILNEYEFKGSYRAITVKPIGLKVIELSDDEFNNDKLKLKIEFSLGRGSYATMLLRELIK
ncbi:MAG: tRNA pseudouridine(13) synthase TruD [Promethearchaeota archaeon]